MTDEELAEVAAKALQAAKIWGQRERFSDEYAAAMARNVLAAVEPKIRADERERAARIADARIETLCMVRHVKVRKRRPDGEFEFVDGAIREAETIAAAIRDENYGRNPPR